MNRILETAKLIARLAHQGQTDKAGRPYIEHPARVAASVAHLGTDHEIVGWLHDVVEDTPVSMREIRNIFGDFIAEAVFSVTRIEPKYQNRLEFLEGEVLRRETYREFVFRSKENLIGWAVKIADVCDNGSPTRMKHLLQDEQDFLTERYAKAREWLMTDGAPLEWKTW